MSDRAGRRSECVARRPRSPLSFWPARLAVVVAWAVLAMVSAGSALACNDVLQDGNYNVAGNTWLKAYYNRDYDDNNAFINTNWSVCEKLIAPASSPELRYSYKCATNGFAYGFSNDLGRAPYPNCNTTMSALMLNNQSSSATFDFYQHY